MGHIEVKDKLFLVTESEEILIDILANFVENYSEVLASTDGIRYALYIKPCDRHFLSQEQIESMIELPENFYEI